MASLPIIQSLWIGEELSTMEQLTIRSFQTHGHEFHLYAYDPIRNVPAGTVIEDAATCLPRDKIFTYAEGVGKGSYGGFANWFRYELLLQKGGIWVDMDMVCLKPFDFPEDLVISGESDINTQQPVAGNCVLKAPAGHRLFEGLLNICRQLPKDNLRVGQTGPYLMQRALVYHDLQQFRVRPEIFCPIPYWKAPLLAQPVPRRKKMLARSHAVHLWNEVWRREGLDKDGKFPQECLYEELKARYL